MLSPLKETPGREPTKRNGKDNGRNSQSGVKSERKWEQGTKRCRTDKIPQAS